VMHMRVLTSLVFSFLRMLSTWHCPHSSAACHCRSAIDRYLLPVGPTAANLQQPLHGPCSTYCAGCASQQCHMSWICHTCCLFVVVFRISQLFAGLEIALSNSSASNSCEYSINLSLSSVYCLLWILHSIGITSYCRMTNYELLR